MDKKNLRDQLWSFLQGYASKQGEEAFNRWLEDLGPDTDDELTEEQLQQSLESVKRKVDFSIHRFRFQHQTRFALRIAASIAMFIVVGYAGFKFFPLTSKTNSQISVRVLVSKRSQMLKALLPDSSVVWLNADSKLSFPAVFSDSIREVTLIGEAFFQVKRNEKCRFVVRTASELTTVLGTSFLVRAYPTDSITTVAVASGKVRVSAPPTALQPEQTFILTKNQQVIHKGSDNKMIASEVVVTDLIEWKDGTMVFRDKSLKEILPILERWYDVKIVITESALLEKTFNAKYHQASLQHVLRSLSTSAGFAYEIKDRTVTITPK